MKHKEKEYLIAFKLYIDHFDPRYRYPKWIKAINKTDAITKYVATIKPDLTLGACIIMDERPIKHDETKEDVKEMKESVVKGERTNTTDRVALDILDHAPIFDIEAASLNKGYAYLLEKFNDDGSVERKVIVIIDISEDRIDYIWRETAHDTIRREGTLTPRGFEKGSYKLYPITAEDIK